MATPSDLDVLALATPRRTSPLAAIFIVFRAETLRTFAPVVLIAVSSGRTLLVLVGGTVVGAVYGVLSWLRRTWSFDGAVLHLDEGVLVRSQRRIPVERIQHVELERRLRHQVSGLAAVRVETAGGSGSELGLDAITLGEAETLRRAVQPALDRRAGAPAGDDGAAVAVDAAGVPIPPPPPPPEIVLVRLRPARLLLAGITGPEVLVVLSALAVLLDTLVDLGIDPEEVGEANLGRWALVGLLAVGVPVWFLTAGLVGVVRKWDLTATVRGGELRVRYGLLRKQQFTMQTERVQDARISQRVLLRPFGRADVRLRSAASGAGDSSRVDIPLLAADEIDRVLACALPDAVPRVALEPAPPAARARSLVRGAAAGVLAGGLATVVAAAAGRSVLGVGVGLAVAAAGVALGELRYRGLGWASARGVDVSRIGVLARRTWFVPRARLQSTAVAHTWFQRRRGLADARYDLAGASVPVRDRSLDQARSISGCGD